MTDHPLSNEIKIHSSEYVSTTEAATLLNVSIDTIRRWRRKGDITSARLPNGHHRYKKSALLNLLEEHAPTDGAA